MSELGAAWTEIFAPWQTYQRGKQEKAAARHSQQMEREATEREAAAASAQAQRTAAALEQRQARLDGLLNAMDSETTEIVRIVEKIRQLSRSEALEADPEFVSKATKELAEWEAGLVRVQASGRGAVGSTDMAELSTAIEDANQAVYVMKAVRARALALQKQFANKAKEIQAEKIRLEMLMQQRRDLEARERAAAARLEDERRLSRDRAAAAVVRDARLAEMKRASEIDLEIARERRQLAAAKAELEAVRSRLIDAENRKREAAIKAAAAASIRAA